LGRWTAAAGKKAGAILAVLDEFTCDKVKQAAVDEIYTKKPVLMWWNRKVCAGSAVAGGRASASEWTRN